MTIAKPYQPNSSSCAYYLIPTWLLCCLIRYWSLIGQQFPHSRPLTNQENLQFKLSNKLILTFVLFNCTIVYYYLYINTRLVSSKAAAVHEKIPNFSFQRKWHLWWLCNLCTGYVEGIFACTAAALEDFILIFFHRIFCIYVRNIILAVIV